MTPELDRLTSPEYLTGLAKRTLDDVRLMRAECQQLENSASYVRRLAQGRLDIVGGELTRRRDGGDPGDLSELIGRLPDLLTEHRGSPGASSQRAPLEMEPSFETTAPLEALLAAIVDNAQVGAIAERSDAELEEIITALHDFEVRISQARRRLHDTIDILQGEITRRYRSGEADVDSLLTD